LLGLRGLVPDAPQRSDGQSTCVSRSAHVRFGPDSRVSHFWDEARSIGRWFERHVTRLGEPDEDRVEWDAYCLYEPDALWMSEAPVAVSWGRTIVETSDQLTEALDRMLASNGPAGGAESSLD